MSRKAFALALSLVLGVAVTFVVAAEGDGARPSSDPIPQEIDPPPQEEEGGDEEEIPEALAPITIILLDPADGATYTAPADVPLRARTTVIEDGYWPSSVKFLAGGTWITATTTDDTVWTATWNNVPAGAYGITAVVYYQGGSNSSAQRNIVVVSPNNQPPTVSLTAPANNHSDIAPASVTVAATAADSDGSVTRVEFFKGTTKIGEDLSSPYSIVWNESTPGTYSLTAKAWDNGNASKVSAARTVTIHPNSLPSISITNPAHGATIQAPATVQIRATASDSDGEIDRVEFRVDGALIGSDSSSPYAVNWATGTTGGNRSITAKAIDNKGGEEVAGVSVTLNGTAAALSANPDPCPLYDPGQTQCLTTVSWSTNAPSPEVWYSYDEYNGSEDIHYEDIIGTGASGSEQFSIGPPKRLQKFQLKSNGVVLATVRPGRQWAPTVSLTSPTNNQIFQAPATVTINATAADQDGAVALVEFFSGSTKIGEDSTSPYSYIWSNVGAGTRTLKARAYDDHNAWRDSTPVSVIVNAQPTVSLTEPADDLVIPVGTPVTFKATAGDSDDSINRVEFLVDGTEVGQDTSGPSPYTFTWTNPTRGTHQLTARAYDNRGGVTTSTARTLIVNAPPAVSLTSPANGAVLTAPTSLTLTANATDADGSGTITKVEYFRNGSRIATVTSSANGWRYILPNAEIGDYEFTAKVTDNRGASATSDPVAVSVKSQLHAELPTHDPTVGALAGKPATSGGAATYEIPIAVPPGRRGMQPALALSYSSRAGNGIAGMGWSLSGLSSIHRCPQTIEQDGAIRPVQLDGSDRLCLDGQRLVAVSGTYGATNTQYKTELDSFARITQLGNNLASGVTYFKVELKSGEVVWYGGTSTATNTARVVPSGSPSERPLSWLIERRQDRVGNLVRYAYTDQGDGEVLLSSVLYTGFGTTDGNRKVAFTYETRPTASGANDQSSSYLAGGLTRQTQRLKSVLTSVGTEKVREYLLAYQTSTHSKRSLLGSVTDCAYAGSTRVCKQPTTFAWQQSAPTYAFQPVELSTNAPALDLARVITLTPTGDFDGDGATEVVWMQVHATNPVINEFFLTSLDGQGGVRWAISLPQTRTDLGKTGLDFDLDGKADILGTDASGNQKIWFWHGPANATTFAQAFTESWDTGIDGLLAHAGDMDGDGRADLVVQVENPAGGESCRRKLKVYRNLASGSGAVFEAIGEHCLTVVLPSGGGVWPEQLHQTTDFDGDGLPDLWIRSHGYAGAHGINRVVFGRRAAGGYSLQAVTASALFPSSDPRRTGELNAGMGQHPPTELSLDINGDGLDDLLYAGSDARWHGRLNRGGQFGDRIQFESGSSGLSTCAYDPVDMGLGSQCDSYLKPFDYDADARAELLIPRQFAARICNFVPAHPLDDPPGEWTDPYWVCPENPLTGTDDLGDYPKINGAFMEVRAMYQNGLGGLNRSKYYADALRFVQTGPNQYRIDRIPTSIIMSRTQSPQDLLGDGLSDLLVPNSCGAPPSHCGIPTAYGDGTPIPESASPRTYPDGSSVTGSRLFLNDNNGPGGVPSPDGLTPKTPDLLSMVTDGLGNHTVWTYYPLSSKAGRAAGETPLYTVPTDPEDRYIDARHFYFTSSMPVVAEMAQSDGIGGERAWRYGYSEAMYHAQGRGFAGFRAVIEEDETAGLRTTTKFHQKFPLTGQVEQVIVNALHRAGTSAPITIEDYAWRCNRANRTDTAACTPPNGTATVKFPYLDKKETYRYDATVALATSGTPQAIGYRAEVNAADGRCGIAGGEATAAGFDAHGNPTASTELVMDLGPTGGADGFRRFLDRRCVYTTAHYTADTAAWWLDKLNQRTVKRSLGFVSATHPLPAGANNPIQTVVTDYLWNADRTLKTETVQPGVSHQQRVTAYSYLAPTNYGLPTGVAVSASGDPNGTRSSGTAYSTDGYVPQTITNPLGHAVHTATRARDGQPSQTIDANGLETAVDYDAFGVAVRMSYRGPDGLGQVAPDRQVAVRPCGSDCNVAADRAKYTVTEVQDGAPTTVRFFDGFARTTRVRTRLPDASWSHVITRYDALGRVQSQSEPYRSGAETGFSTTFAYDALNRMTRKVVPKALHDGRGDLETTYLYAGRETLIAVCGTADTPADACLALGRTTDALGRYVETIDAKGGVTKFWQDAGGSTLALKDANASITTAGYNALGQRTGVDDPNQGAWTFAYNALGELRSQTDARGVVTSFAYDKLGRPTQRSADVDITGDGDPDALVDTWSYDPAHGLGQLDESQRTRNDTLERRQTRTYDSLSRPDTTHTRQLVGASTYREYAQGTTYDGYFGRPVTRTWPNGEAVEAAYGLYGHVIRELDAASGTVYRELTATDARGAPTGEALGDGVMTSTWSTHARTGQVTGIVHKRGGTTLRNLTYRYDVFGNLSQQSLLGGSTEDYLYDDLHRLTQATRTGAASGTVKYGFDTVGNPLKKTDFSLDAPNAYTYTGGSCGGGPNAVKAIATAAGTRSYCYDGNGNLTSDNAGLAVRYDHRNLPVRTQRGSTVLGFAYGADDQRTRQWDSSGTTTRIYLAGYEDLPQTGETKVYVGDHTVISHNAAGRFVRYLLKDRLGSVDAIADTAGTLVESRGYDAYGKPRQGNWADATPPRLGSTAITPKGFTQHEHLNGVELIHMNGRAYDYALGRFLSVDPLIQSPLNSQSLNPYSYVLNNPMSGTDPTGYATCKLEDSASCLNEEGKHTITDSRGNKLGTVNVGEKNVTFAPNMAGIAKSLRSSGADLGQFVKGALTKAKDGASALGSKASDVGRGVYEQTANNLVREGWESDYACERMGCATGESHSLKAQGVPLMLPYPEPAATNEQQFGRDLEPAVAIALGLVTRNPRTALENSAEGVLRKVHKNSLDYVGNTHVYVVRGPDGAPFKIGESAQGLRMSDGASKRAEQQARQLQRETGERYPTRIQKTFDSKADARDYETRLIERFRRWFGDDALPGNKTNR